MPGLATIHVQQEDLRGLAGAVGKERPVLPSGDQRADLSCPGPRVSWRAPLPSMATLQMQVTYLSPSRSTERSVQAILSPSGLPSSSDTFR
ncbi:hypothetical protein HK414_16985 [Ramlibacter terrae]|uniref:Uncharacterized protein n=1 Tax=Ramlibacter terrae TaxID=2732511 RepID=A0ABX6P1J8_9BURK|nr:hypothetical protein HK414_16985 [Ramlibacter terrae]